MSPAKYKNDQGFSLLEVMIGMLVLALGLLGLAPMIILSIDGNTIARDNNIVSNLIKEKIEQFENIHPDSLPTVPYTEYEQGCSLPGNAEQANRSLIYSRVTQLTDSSTNGTVPNDLYELQVQIQWTDNKSVQRSTTYKTYLLKG